MRVYNSTIDCSLSDTNTTIAMLCKTSVARNVFAEMKRTHTNFSACDLFEFNANKVFGINASACLLVIELCESELLLKFVISIF